MVRLRLLDGPAEEFAALVIETDESEARHEAIEAHVTWLQSGQPADRERYAYRLLHWARLRGDAKARRYAERLLADGPAVDAAAALAVATRVRPPGPRPC